MKLQNCTAAITLSLIALFCIAAGCEHDPKPQQRPHSVPADAQWIAPHASTDEAGAYYDCSSGTPGAPVNECTVWNDTDGSVRVSGRFILKDLNRPAEPTELQYAAADSSHIYLSDGYVLQHAN